MNILGLDIGGVNTKAAYISTRAGQVERFKTIVEHFPFWKRDEKQLCSMLSALKVKLSGSAALDCVAVTLTAELSDVFLTKREGVNYIVDCVRKVFKDELVLVLNVNSALISVEAAKEKPFKVAAANWVATGWMVSQYFRDCVIVDVGSTSTSIIPVVEGKLAASGKTDLEKLIYGELVYTGSLRTNLAAIVSEIPLKGGWAKMSSEFFSQSGDVHLVLKNIKEEDYVVDTPDGKGKARDEALARLARIVCADIEMLKEEEILQMAKYIYNKQVEQIAEGLGQVYSRLFANSKDIVPSVATGLGKEFLARKAAEKIKVTKIVSIDELAPKGAALASPAAGIALMAATKLEGRCPKWKL